jgi:hypothetical protein
LARSRFGVAVFSCAEFGSALVFFTPALLGQVSW